MDKHLATKVSNLCQSDVVDIKETAWNVPIFMHRCIGRHRTKQKQLGIFHTENYFTVAT